jgi:hypothetical protein
MHETSWEKLQSASGEELPALVAQLQPWELTQLARRGLYGELPKACSGMPEEQRQVFETLFDQVISRFETIARATGSIASPSTIHAPAHAVG